MLPPELEAQSLLLPASENHSIVIVTGNALRYRRFAYRILQEFGEEVVAWYELDSSISPKEAKTKNHPSSSIATPSKYQKLTAKLKELPRTLSRYGLIATFKKFTSLANDAYYRFVVLRNQGRAMQQAEERLFAEEIAMIQKKISRQPVRIHPSDVHTTWFKEEIAAIDPYFFLTLSGSLYRKPLLETIRGAAINQHAGHSPLYKGSNTIHWALYHRDLSAVSATVHITTTGADAGQILRRSNPALFPDDEVHTVFLRSVALGTELMIESVREIMRDKTVTVFAQPEGTGKTYLNKAYDFPIMKALFRDFCTGWFKTALYRRRDF